MTARRIRVRGQVQGVGFRPFVWQLATRMGLAGEVLNDSEGVLILVAGPDLDAFAAALRNEAPPLARIDAIEVQEGVAAPPPGFRIAPSGRRGADTAVAPDAATCTACQSEIRDPAARRYRYAFTNCTDCGPRFSIITGLPYDRARTTMAAFAMCDACRAEYENPSDRRFHAQPIACPTCGPRLWFEAGGKVQKGDPVTLACDLLRAGGVVAIKGLGGFHLACNALDARAVDMLRQRKRRPAKPFALMASSDVIACHACVSSAEAALMNGPAAPIVLLDRAELQAGVPPLAEALAPGLGQLGWMRPHSPLHHLLCDALGMPLVMTSGNLSGTPQATENDEARQRLGQIADGFLLHDRAIARRLDDGVERIGPAGHMVLRRGRGRAPASIALPPGLADTVPVVAYGGQMKAALCLVKGAHAVLSQHLGDLDDPATVAEFITADQDYANFFEHCPQSIAVDAHPDFHATRHGQERSLREGLALIEVQHHHAHMAAALGEAGWQGERAVGIVLDGFGLGPDGSLWGGEVLLGNYQHVTRAGGLCAAPLVGGDRAAREPWRNAVVRLDAAGLGLRADALFADLPVAALRRAGLSGAGFSSSAGRLFDAVAACLGLVPARQSYEGEAAMRLEALAKRALDARALEADAPDAGAYAVATGHALDPAPMFVSLVRDLDAGVRPEVISARFHLWLALSFARLARTVAAEAGTLTIALSGGCFQNAVLLEMTLAALPDLEICIPRVVPANDGGLAYGQALIAAARGRTEHTG